MFVYISTCMSALSVEKQLPCNDDIICRTETASAQETFTKPKLLNVIVIICGGI